MKHIKCVVVGDTISGKTTLLISYTTNAFPGEYVPTVFDNYSVNVLVEDQAINIQLWDTSGQEDYKKLRPLSYIGADVFILAFSLCDPTSLENIENIWLPEITEHCPGTPYILVGTNSSFRDEFSIHETEYKSKGWEPVSTERSEQMKNKICAADYVECDPLKQFHLKEVFESAIKCVLHPPSKLIGKPIKNKKKRKFRFKFCCSTDSCD